VQSDDDAGNGFYSNQTGQGFDIVLSQVHVNEAQAPARHVTRTRHDQSVPIASPWNVSFTFSSNNSMGAHVGANIYVILLQRQLRVPHRQRPILASAKLPTLWAFGRHFSRRVLKMPQDTLPRTSRMSFTIEI